MKLKYFSYLLLFFIHQSFACTNFMFAYHNQYLVARNLDWNTKNFNIVINPINKIHHANQIKTSNNPLIWKAKFGSITFIMPSQKGIDYAAILGGMNQKGVVISAAELDQAKFPPLSNTLPNINNTLLIQYLLDTSSSVRSAIHHLQKINVVTTIWNGKTTPIHFVIHDARGHSAIIEYLAGHMHIYQGNSLPYRILTNTAFTDTFSIWQHKQMSQQPLAGTASNTRYFRGLEYLQHLPTPTSVQQAIGYAFAGLQLTAEPPGTPWPTMWSVVYNTHTLTVYYRTLDDPRLHVLPFSDYSFHKQCQFPINTMTFRC